MGFSVSNYWESNFSESKAILLEQQGRKNEQQNLLISSSSETNHQEEEAEPQGTEIQRSTHQMHKWNKITKQADSISHCPHNIATVTPNADVEKFPGPAVTVVDVLHHTLRRQRQGCQVGLVNDEGLPGEGVGHEKAGHATEAEEGVLQANCLQQDGQHQGVGDGEHGTAKCH